MPALAAFAIFQFLWVWNDLLVAYVFLGGTEETSVLTVALRGLVGQRGENWHLLTAAASSRWRSRRSCSSRSRSTSSAGSRRRGEGMSVADRVRRSPLAGTEPLPPRLKWRAI